MPDEYKAVLEGRGLGPNFFDDRSVDNTILHSAQKNGRDWVELAQC